jgi:hypothetical protein
MATRRCGGSGIVLSGCVSTKNLASRKIQNCTDKRYQHPAYVDFWNDWNIAPAILLSVILAIVAFTVIRTGKSHGGENQGGHCDSEDFADVVL